jgi:hypothetical protein
MGAQQKMGGGRIAYIDLFAGPGRYNPTLTPARYIKGRTVDKIMACGILA